MPGKKPRIVAFIPVRGGSKRLPGKNIKPFLGKPLLYYTVHFAKQAGCFDRIIVSTEDKAIAAVAKTLGAEVLWRPGKLASDTASTTAVAVHLTEALEKEKYSFDILATLQATNPLRNRKLMKEGLAAFSKGKGDSLMSVSRNRHKLGTIIKGQFVPSSYEPGQRSQDMKEEYFENGLLYLTRYNTLKEQRDLFGKKIIPLITAEAYASVDIDEAEDFELAEYMYRKYKKDFI